MPEPSVCDAEIRTGQPGRSLRILMVSLNTPPFVFAGAGNQAVLLSQAMIQRGCKVRVMTAGTAEHHDAWTQAALGTLPVTLTRGSSSTLGRMLWMNLLAVLWMIRHHRELDVIHVHGCTHLSTVIWVLLARVFGVRSLYKVSCDGVDDLSSIRRYPVLGRLAFALMKQLDGLVALTPAIARDARQYLPENRVFEVTNSYDDRVFHPAPSAEKPALRRELGLPSAGCLLIYSGGVNPRKNPQFLVEVLAGLPPQNDPVHLLMVGPCKAKFAGYREQLLAQIEALGLKERVHLTGLVPYQESARYLQAADVFVFASSQEGQPSSPVEAMACGLPTVICRIDGVTDWIYPPGCEDAERVFREGLPAVVSLPDQQSFSTALIRLIESQALRDRMGETAAEHARHQFGLSAVLDDYLARIYPALCRL
ncbi:MAG: glycosyltransferase family 4 protein [Candidatus Melainabacteria bacterium]